MSRVVSHLSVFSSKMKKSLVTLDKPQTIHSVFSRVCWGYRLMLPTAKLKLLLRNAKPSIFKTLAKPPSTSVQWDQGESMTTVNIYRRHSKTCSQRWLRTPAVRKRARESLAKYWKTPTGERHKKTQAKRMSELKYKITRKTVLLILSQRFVEQKSQKRVKRLFGFGP